MTGPPLILLAGGRSTRMGRPKHELRVGDATLLRWQLTRLRPFFSEVIVVGAPAPDGARTVADARDAAGPLAGIEAGLRAVRTDDHAFVLACDMPRVRPTIAPFLLRIGVGRDAVVPRVRGIAQPASALYARSSGPKISAFLDSGNRRLTLALDQLDVRYVDDDELAAAGHRPDEFTDLDTPADYEAFIAEMPS